MANDNDTQVDDIPEVPDLPTVEEGKQDTTDWKAKAMEMQGTLTKVQGIAKRFKTKVDKLSGPKPEANTAEPKASAAQNKGFDYGQLAYLETKGVSHADDQAYLEGLIKESGIELRTLLGKGWVQAELKERAQLRATAEATPSGTKRAGNTTRDQVDYWIAKGELPPNTPENRKLRQDVVKAKIAAANNKSQFAGQSVVQ